MRRHASQSSSPRKGGPFRLGRRAAGLLALLFLAGPTADGGARRFLEAVAQAPVLTVGESKAFLRAGGMIRLLRRGSKLRFQIRRGAAEKEGLRIGSHLLKLEIVGRNLLDHRHGEYGSSVICRTETAETQGSAYAMLTWTY